MSGLNALLIGVALVVLLAELYAVIGLGRLQKSVPGHDGQTLTSIVRRLAIIVVLAQIGTVSNAILLATAPVESIDVRIVIFTSQELLLLAGVLWALHTASTLHKS